MNWRRLLPSRWHDPEPDGDRSRAVQAAASEQLNAAEQGKQRATGAVVRAGKIIREADRLIVDVERALRVRERGV